MSTVDQFASVFNAASQTAFQHQPPALENALVVTDLEPDAAEKYAGSVRTFFGAVTGKWEIVHGGGEMMWNEISKVLKNEYPKRKWPFRQVPYYLALIVCAKMEL